MTRSGSAYKHDSQRSDKQHTKRTNNREDGPHAIYCREYSSAGNALLKNVRDGLLGEDIVRHVQRSVRKAIGEYKKQHSAKSESIRSLEARTREISDKLKRVANAIESMGLNNTLRDRIHSLEADKKATEASIVKAESAQPQMDGLPDIFPVSLPLIRPA